MGSCGPIVLAATVASVLGACASISGLDAYTSDDCPFGCDASVDDGAAAADGGAAASAGIVGADRGGSDRAAGRPRAAGPPRSDRPAPRSGARTRPPPPTQTAHRRD